MKKISHEKFVFDNATFSNFARIEKLELIFYISKNIYTTKEVIEEVKKGVIKKPKLQSIIDNIDTGKIKVETLKKQQSIFMMSNLIKEGILGLGEISAMMLSQELSGIFITDDEKATEKAKKENIKILDVNELGIKISTKNKFKDTVIFLEILKKQKIVSQTEFEEIKKFLEAEKFIF